MLRYLLAISLFCSVPAGAAQLVIENFCNPALSIEEDIDLGEVTTVSELTFRTLKKWDLPVVGDAAWIESMMGSPVGDDQIEIISNRRLRSYGWCYTVNGTIPTHKTADRHMVTNHDKVRWYYGYAEFYQGNWVSMCAPARNPQTNPICRSWNRLELGPEIRKNF